MHAQSSPLGFQQPEHRPSSIESTKAEIMTFMHIFLKTITMHVEGFLNEGTLQQAETMVEVTTILYQSVITISPYDSVTLPLNIHERLS